MADSLAIRSSWETARCGMREKGSFLAAPNPHVGRAQLNRKMPGEHPSRWYEAEGRFAVKGDTPWRDQVVKRKYDEVGANRPIRHVGEERLSAARSRECRVDPAVSNGAGCCCYQAQGSIGQL